MSRLFLIAFMLLSAGAHAVTLEQVLADKHGGWTLPADGKIQRWIIIHNLDQAAQSHIFHIEVIGRKKGDQPWQVMHLQKHMAIAADALPKDLVAAKSGALVYPESFDTAYGQWQKARPQIICQSSILQCLRPGL